MAQLTKLLHKLFYNKPAPTNNDNLHMNLLLINKPSIWAFFWTNIQTSSFLERLRYVASSIARSLLLALAFALSCPLDAASREAGGCPVFLPPERAARSLSPCTSAVL